MNSNIRFHFDQPSTRQELLEATSKLFQQATDFWSGLPNDYFFTPYGDKWSPAENVRHLNTSTRPVVTALRLPRIVPRLLFGIATRPSRSFAQIQEAYLQTLSKGGQAGSYAPKRMPFPQDVAIERERIMGAWRATWKGLISATQRWEDAPLDQLRLPHPLLGKLTIREMLFFTMFHHLHHLKNVAQRKIGCRCG